jgi:hypothetical protein
LTTACNRHRTIHYVWSLSSSTDVRLRAGLVSRRQRSAKAPSVGSAYARLLEEATQALNDDGFDQFSAVSSRFRRREPGHHVPPLQRRRRTPEPGVPHPVR